MPMTHFGKISYAGCFMPHRMINNLPPLFYSQMKLSEREKAWSTSTIHMCSHTKIPSTLFRRKFTRSSALTPGQGLSWIIWWDRTFWSNDSMAKISLFSYNTSTRFWCNEYRPICARTCGSCIMVHKHILRCVTTWMLHISGGGLDAADPFLVLYAPRTSIAWISSSGDIWNLLFTRWCRYTGGSDPINCRRLRRHLQQFSYAWTSPPILRLSM